MKRETLEKIKTREFHKGFICACSTMVRSHGLGVEVREALGCIGTINWSQVDPFDREALADIRKEMRRRAEMRKP